MASDISLTNPTINSGNPIYLRGITLNYTFKPLTRVTPNVNSFALAEGQYAGFQNPRIIINGVINTNNLTSSTIQHTSLLAFSKVQYDGSDSTATTLAVLTGNANAPLYAANATTSTIRVFVENFNCVLGTTSSDLAHLWNYTLSLSETA